jgi:hypothetical protein
MTEYSNTNRGSIWKNDKKEKDTNPDFTGSLNVDGREYWVSAWKRKDGAGPKSPALSFSVKPKDGEALVGGKMMKAGEPNPSQSISQRAMPKARSTEFRQGQDDMNDEIPF